MSDKVVLITGASSGIGKATAEHLAAKGYRVFATARRLERLEPMRSNTLEALPLDVTSEASIQAVLGQVLRKFGRIDVLVNNAGYGLYGTVEDVSNSEARKQFDVNVFGLANMCKAVLPTMRQQNSGRIINISSVAGRLSTPMAGWYAASKHAVEGLSDALRLEVASFGVQVVLIQPGAIKTEFDKAALEALRQNVRTEAYKGMAQAFASLVQNSYRKAPGPEVVAKVVQKAIEAVRPAARYAVPMDSRMYIIAKGMLSDTMMDRMLRSQMRG